MLLKQSWKSFKSWTWIIFCWNTKTWFIFLRISFSVRANKKFLSDFLQNWLDICLHSESNSWTFLIKLRIDFFSVKMSESTVLKLMKKLRNSVSRLMRMLEDTIFWSKLLVFLYDSKLSAVNLIFDQVIICNDSTQIKFFVSEFMSLIWQLYYLFALINAAVASLLTSIDIKLSICHSIKSFLWCSSFCFTI